jgi:hypothetical protein
MPENLLSQIKAQKALSTGVMKALLPIMQAVYFPDRKPEEIACGDMGSFARGTNSSQSPDLDIGFFGASNDEAHGYKDWTPIGTLQLTGKKEGITGLAELSQYDPLMAQAMQQVQNVIEAHFEMPPGSTQFNFTRSWVGYPGWVSNFSLPHPQYQTVAFDINLAYTPSHYGIEHARRFNCYFERLVNEQGAGPASQLIEDIRRVKKQAKENARNPDGWIDRTRKLAGFVVEGLFMHQYPPRSYTQLMKLVLAHQWSPNRYPRKATLGVQVNQIIDAGFGFSALLENMACDNAALPRGAWENLFSIAQDFQEAEAF